MSLWWSGTSRPQTLTADTASGAGLQGGNEGEVQPPNGDAITAPSADGYPRTQPIRFSARPASATPRERVVDPGDVWWTLVDSWGRPPERRCRGGERCGCAAAGWLLGWLPDQTLTFLALRRIDSQSEAGNGIATSQNRLLTRMHELISLIFCRTSPRQNRFRPGIATAKKLQHAIPTSQIRYLEWLEFWNLD